RDDRDARGPRLRPKGPRQAPPVHAREEQVHEDGIRPLDAREVEPRDAVRGHERLVPGGADDPRRDVEVVGVVLDDQHACHQRLAVRLSRAVSLPARTRMGSVKWNVLPFPTSLSTQIRPPCRVMRRLEIASPSPVPPYRRVVELSAWRNSSKT